MHAEHRRTSRGESTPYFAKGQRSTFVKALADMGSYHVKEMVVDRRFLFTGSANFTSKSRNNNDRCYTMTGACVAQALADLADERADGKRLDSSYS